MNLSKDLTEAAKKVARLEARLKQPRPNLWRLLRIHDVGLKWESQGCHDCCSSWKPGKPAWHYEHCLFHSGEQTETEGCGYPPKQRELLAATAVMAPALRGIAQLRCGKGIGPADVLAQAKGMASAALYDAGEGKEFDLDKHTAWDLEHIPHVEGVDYDIPGEGNDKQVRCLRCRTTLVDSEGHTIHAGNCYGPQEGWLPPDKVEQVRPQGARAFVQWAEANKSRIHRDALDEAAMGYSAGWDAALDALEVK